jgi:hypothetical protein
MATPILWVLTLWTSCQNFSPRTPVSSRARSILFLPTLPSAPPGSGKSHTLRKARPRRSEHQRITPNGCAVPLHPLHAHTPRLAPRASGKVKQSRLNLTQSGRFPGDHKWPVLGWPPRVCELMGLLHLLPLHAWTSMLGWVLSLKARDDVFWRTLFSLAPKLIKTSESARKTWPSSSRLRGKNCCRKDSVKRCTLPLPSD